MREARIVITRELPGDYRSRFAAAGIENVWVWPENRPIPREELLRRLPGAHAAIVTPADVSVNREFFDAAGDQLRVVSCFAVGVDNVELAEAKRRGIIVGHTPYATTEPTADIAWLLLLGAAKRVQEAQRELRSGQWQGVYPTFLLGARVHRKTLFIVGAGRIGYATARRAIGWEMEILYHARTRHEEFERSPINGKRVSLDEGLARADFVSLHTPLTDETRHLIDASRLAKMKPSAILINTSRGAVVDEEALVEALRAKRIAAAGLDVYEHEPKIHPGLLELDNVFLLPHLGSGTVEDRIWMMEIAVDNAIAAIRDEPVPHAFLH